MRDLITDLMNKDEAQVFLDLDRQVSDEQYDRDKDMIWREND